MNVKKLPSFQIPLSPPLIAIPKPVGCNENKAQTGENSSIFFRPAVEIYDLCQCIRSVRISPPLAGEGMGWGEEIEDKKGRKRKSK